MNIEDETNHNNSLLTDDTENVCKDNGVKKVTPDTRTVGFENPSGDTQNHSVESWESGSMTEINSAMARIELTQDVKLSVELDSEDTSKHSYNQKIKSQSFPGAEQPVSKASLQLDLKAEETSHTQKDNATKKTIVWRTPSEQTYIKISALQNRNFYMQQSSRLMSFWNIPVKKARADIVELSKSGFCYDDRTTQIVCVRCGYELQGNPTLEKLNEDHIQKSPRCSEFLKNRNKDEASCEKIHQEEGVQVLKFSGTTSKQHNRSVRAGPRRTAGVKQNAQKRNKIRMVPPRMETILCIDDQQHRTEQKQQISTDSFESKKVPDSRKQNLDQNLYLKIFDVRKKQKFGSFESSSIPSQKETDAIITQLSQPNACLTDHSMKAILRLISHQFPWYHIPCDIDKFFIEDGVIALNTSVEFAQVIFVPPKGYEPSYNKRKKKEGIGHFLLLTNIGCVKVFQVCDSLGERSMKARSHEIIRKCLGLQDAPIMVVKENDVSVQIGNIDCGLYVIAFLIDICLGNSKRLNTVVYNQEYMRGHLIDTIKHLVKGEQIQEFPIVPDAIPRQSKLTVICKKIEFDE